MGMYTGLRLKSTVKKEYSQDINSLINNEMNEDFDWLDCTNMVFKEFGKLPRASLVPLGMLAYMPWDEYDKDFTKGYNKETRELSTQCSLKNYDGELEYFLKIIPIFCESVKNCELLYEEWVNSELYELIGDNMVKTSTEDVWG